MTSKAVAKITPVKTAPPKHYATSSQMRHLAQSAILEEAGTSYLVRLAMWMTCGVVVAFLIWASFTRVDELAVTLGEIVPSSAVQVVQHLEGGIVAEIMVQDGQTVQADQPLVRFDPGQVNAEFEQMRAREAALTLKAERLRAFAEGRKPNFDVVAEEFRHLQYDQEQILGTQIDTQSSSRSVLQEQISQRRSELQALEQQRQSLSEQATVMAEQVAMREELVQKGLTSRIQYLDTQREYSRILGERNKIDRQYRAAQQALNEARSRLVDLGNSLNQDALNEMGAVTAELAQVREGMARVNDRRDRLIMRAPVAGEVQGLKVRTIGAVIPPGGVVMEVVPAGDDLRVETRIPVKDRGYVHVGQDVKVKVTSFDFARFGAIKGKVVTVSPSTLLDEQQQPYYKGIISLSDMYVGPQEKGRKVKAGMTVQADIRTGDKTVLEYLLKPIYVGMAGSFIEK